MIARRTATLMLTLLVPAFAAAQTQRRPSRRSTAARPRTAPAPVRFALAPTGNVARFVVREHLMIMDSPNDAIGVSHDVSGGIVLLPDGRIDPDHSRIVVNLSTLTSDKENRDRWIKSHTLRTDSFPTATFVPRRFVGIAGLPAPGVSTVQLAGDLTVHGVTRPVIWDVALHAGDNEYTGTATTHVKFEDFGMDQPRLMIVISVVDDVKLEYDFHFVRSDP
jgi:polyisoprenoid-binding protein YceI